MDGERVFNIVPLLLLLIYRPPVKHTTQVMCLAIETDNEAEHQVIAPLQAELAQLRAENEGLRELLRISGQSMVPHHSSSPLSTPTAVS